MNTKLGEDAAKSVEELSKALDAALSANYILIKANGKLRAELWSDYLPLRISLEKLEQDYAREHALLNDAAEAAESDLDQVANVIRRLKGINRGVQVPIIPKAK